MNRHTLATGSALAGVAALAACACGAGSNTVKALSAAGFHTPNTVIFGASCGTDHSIQPLFVGIGALLILIGLSLRSLSAAILAAIGCAALAVGSLVSGPSILGSLASNHSGMQMVSQVSQGNAHLLGFIAYPLGAAFLILAFLRAFRTPKPLAAGTAMAGMAAATGCNCCMVTASLSALIASAGMPWIYHQSYVFFTGAAIVSVSLWWLGGIKPALVAAGGAAITYGGPKLLELVLPQLMISGVNYRFVPGYAINLLGAATMVCAFAVAYGIADRRYAVEASRPGLGEPVPVTGG